MRDNALSRLTEDGQRRASHPDCPRHPPAEPVTNWGVRPLPFESPAGGTEELLGRGGDDPPPSVASEGATGRPVETCLVLPRLFARPCVSRRQTQRRNVENCSGVSGASWGSFFFNHSSRDPEGPPRFLHAS